MLATVGAFRVVSESDLTTAARILAEPSATSNKRAVAGRPELSARR
jgi:hypothetical protein